MNVYKEATQIAGLKSCGSKSHFSVAMPLTAGKTSCPFLFNFNLAW